MAGAVLTFLQVAAPSRSKLADLSGPAATDAAASGRVSMRNSAHSWQPISFIGSHQEPPQVFDLYRAADFLPGQQPP